MRIIIPKPQNVIATLEKVRAEVSKEGGVFDGDATRGRITSTAISKDDVEGEYQVEGDKIIIEIIRKPALPFVGSLIEKEIRRVFKKCAV